MTNTPIFLRQDGVAVLAAEPSLEIQVGIHWQPPQTCAANSLCREMVFLADATVAATWQTVAPAQRDCFSLPVAIELGAAFFTPPFGGDDLIFAVFSQSKHYDGRAR